ncbi:MAG: glycerophosphodiester phosphodiesterase [Clostridia bacterium]|nr:glycerophosphodiester phosphodiesterase [Clostridia bacterium]
MNIFQTWIVNKPIAHRGLHNAEIPENSLAAFENACKENYAIELDVRPLSDGTIIVFHDDTLGRMTKQDGYLSNLTYNDIKDLKLNGSSEKIPTLSEVLNLVDGRTPILIEIKNMGKVGEFEKSVLKALEGYKGEYAIESFNPYTLEWFKINAPQIKRGQLSSFMKNSGLSFFKRIVLKKMKLNKISEPHFIAYHTKDLPNKYVKKYKDVMPVIAWCIKNEDEYARVFKKHCDNIIFENITPAK